MYIVCTYAYLLRPLRYLVTVTGAGADADRDGVREVQRCRATALAGAVEHAQQAPQRRYVHVHCVDGVTDFYVYCMWYEYESYLYSRCN